MRSVRISTCGCARRRLRRIPITSVSRRSAWPAAQRNGAPGDPTSLAAAQGRLSHFTLEQEEAFGGGFKPDVIGEAVQVLVALLALLVGATLLLRAAEGAGEG
jgi:hypothetical protein